MTLKFLAGTVSLFLFVLGVTATDWYTVEWDAPQFTALSGDMVIPKLPNPGGIPYVWPALQSNHGVLQAVCDGRSGVWRIADGFYGVPSLPWGNGFNVNPGDTVHFSFTSSGTTWTATLSSNGKSASTTLNIPGSTMNRAIFAVELTRIPFNFGPITYRNVKITATTAASGWCGRILHIGNYPHTVTGNVASGNTCNIASIVQNSPS
ncbi:hypothetical protein Moror_12769 [Moniliophthora roreri MCA 2997]|uniref:Uncharacterized protein n=1 Tax=Moniliophthora roreri (strain MCA 2997) TaxID=1381753 RepID=V2XRG1_MONRO|nr:hypothetical protein Moror_12769 [Moniliophthora roreri MCA 2997]